MPIRERGPVSLVGAGPGDPGLLTRRGHDLLAHADVVVYDSLANDRLLDLAPASAERIYAGKARGKLTIPQSEINRLLVDRWRLGQRVVRLKGGDPFVFGRGAEEAEYLRSQGVPFVVVPGVTAGVGATAYAGLAVTHRAASSAVAFVSGHDDPEAGEPGPDRLDWNALAAFPGTLVVYMGVTRLASVCRTLIRLGKPAETPAAFVRSGTLPRQRTVVATLADLPNLVAEARLGPPALIVIGAIVARRAALSWFEERPLFGRTILVTRPAEESDRSTSDLEELGAEVLLAPMVAIRPVDDPGPLDAAIGRLESFDWLVFTSANGVTHFLDRLEALGRDLRTLGRVKLAAIGPATARALAGYRLRADIVPESHSSEALAERLAEVAPGARILLARADRGRAVLDEKLSAVARVESVVVYRHNDIDVLSPAVADRIEAGTVDWITLTSPAIVARLHALLDDRARGSVGRTIRLASISPLTTSAANGLGWDVTAEASEATWPGLVAAILEKERRPEEVDGSAASSAKA